MVRPTYDPLQLDQHLKPAAQPIDTFVRPAEEPRNTDMLELANGLKSLNVGLQSWVDARRAKQDEEDAIRAEADFHKNNAVGYAEGVRSGAIPAQASPAYVKAYKRTQGDVAGANIGAKFQAAYDAWGDKGNPDPAAFDGFLKGFLKDNIGTDDPEILAGVLPRIRTLAQNAQQQHTADASRIMKQGANQARAAQVDNAISDENTAALVNRKAPDWKGTVKKIEAYRDEHLKAGGDAATIDNLIVDAVTARAVELRSEGPKLLDEFFNSKVPGKDYTWGSTPYGRDQKQKAIDSLERIGRHEQVEDRRVRAEQSKKELEDVTRGVINGIVKDPNAPIDEALIKQGEKLDGDFRVKALGWQKTILTSRGQGDPVKMRELHWDIINGGGMTAIRKAMERGDITNADDLKSVITLNEKMTANGKKVADIMATGSSKSILATIKERTLSKDDLGSLFSPDGLSDTGLAAQLDFKRQVLEWSVQNPDASPLEVEEQVAKIGQGILSRIGRGDGGTGAATYERPKDAPQNPYSGPQGGSTPSPASPPPAAPQAPPAAPQSTQPPWMPGGSAVPPAQLAPGLQQQGSAKGLLLPGNIDLNNRPVVRNADGSISTVRSMSIGVDGREYLIPTISDDGRVLSDEQAVDQFRRTGRHLGAFDTPENATAYAKALHEQQAEQYGSRASGRASNANADDVMQWFSTLSPEQRQQAQASAERSGKSLTQTAAEAYQRGIQQGVIKPPAAKPQQRSDAFEGATVQTARLTSPEGVSRALADILGEENAPSPNAVTEIANLLQQAITGSSRTPSRNYQLAVLNDDPQAARILDFIAGPESSGNYNAYFSNAGSTKDLSKMTFDEVFAWARKRGTKSSATGRYQFMYKTAMGLKEEMGLSGSEKFTPELQDRMAVELLKRRGYDEWRGGKMSTTQFALNLAREWASLPDPRTGRSVYAGDGLNKSLVGVKQVMKALGGDEA